MKKEITGFSYITVSAIFFGSYGIWSKLMVSSFGDFSQAWIRGVILLVILIPFAIATKQLKKIEKRDFIWFAIIALCGGLNQAPYYYAFHNMNVGTATLFFCASLTIAGYVVGKIFFNESLTLVRIASLVLAVVGIAITSKFLLSGSVFAISCAILAGAMGGVEVCLSKKVSGNYSPVQLLVTIFTVMLIGNVTIASFSHDYIHIQVTGLFAEIAYALSMLFANYAVFIGYRYVDAIIGSLIGLTEILFAILLGFIIFRQTIDIYTLLGGSTIIISIALPMLCELYQEKYTQKNIL